MPLRKSVEASDQVKHEATARGPAFLLAQLYTYVRGWAQNGSMESLFEPQIFQEAVLYFTNPANCRN